MLDAQKRNHASSENESGQVSDPEPASGNPDAGTGGANTHAKTSARQIGFSGIGLNHKGLTTNGSYTLILWIVDPYGRTDYQWGTLAAFAFWGGLSPEIPSGGCGK